MSEVPQRRPQRAIWVFPAAVRQQQARRVASPPPLPGYLCEQCQDAPAVQWQAAPGVARWGSVRPVVGREGRTSKPVKRPENSANIRL